MESFKNVESFKVHVPANNVKNSFSFENRRSSSTLAHQDSGHRYYDLTERLTPDGDTFELEQRKYKGADYYPHISEKQNVSLDGKCKTIEVQYVKDYGNSGQIYSSVQELKNDGTYSVVRKKGNEIIGGYELKPVDKKFAKGIKGKLQRAAMRLGADANGCERPVLRRVSEFMLKMLKKVK